MTIKILLGIKIKIKSIGITNLKSKLGSILSLYYKNHQRKLKLLELLNQRQDFCHSFLSAIPNALGKKVGLIGTIEMEFFLI